MVINVTEEDIVKGIKKSCYNCPIAHAAVREAKQDCVAIVTWHCLSVHNGEGRLFSGDVPKEAQQFIIDFDEGKEVKPFSFELLIKDK